MSDFDDRSGVVRCMTEWGAWYQTIDEVVIEISVEGAVTSKDVRCEFHPNKIVCRLRGTPVIEGKLSNTIVADEALWTLEDKKLIRIVLTKCDKTAANCWTSLLTNQYEADPLTFDQMQKKLTLHRFQLENPGFDFSGAEMTGNYAGGGPELS